MGSKLYTDFFNYFKCDILLLYFSLFIYAYSNVQWYLRMPLTNLYFSYKNLVMLLFKSSQCYFNLVLIQIGLNTYKFKVSLLLIKEMAGSDGFILTTDSRQI